MGPAKISSSLLMYGLSDWAWKNFKCPSPLHIGGGPRESPEFIKTLGLCPEFFQVPRPIYIGKHMFPYFFIFSTYIPCLCFMSFLWGAP